MISTDNRRILQTVQTENPYSWLSYDLNTDLFWRVDSNKISSLWLKKKKKDRDREGKRNQFYRTCQSIALVPSTGQPPVMFLLSPWRSGSLNIWKKPPLFLIKICWWSTAMEPWHDTLLFLWFHFHYASIQVNCCFSTINSIALVQEQQCLLVQTETWGLIALKYSTSIHGPQRMNPTDSSDL